MCETANDTGTMETHDGLKLRYALFECDGARGTVLIIAGRSEFIEKYAETVRDLRSAGYAAAIFDLRGQGGSERRPLDGDAGHIDRFCDYPRDGLDFFETCVKPALPGPYFLFGHSLGGLIALSIAEQAGDRFAGLVLSAPFVGLKHARYPAWLIRVGAWCASHCGFARRRTSPKQEEPPRFEAQSHTADRKRYERNLAAARRDPPCLLGPPTFGWLSACLEEIAQATKPAALGRVSCPAFVITAGRDSLIPQCPQSRVAEALRARHLVLPEAGHEIFQEVDAVRRPALTAMLSFFDDCKKPPPA